MIKQKYGNGYWIGRTVYECPKCLSLYHFVPFAFVVGIVFLIVSMGLSVGLTYEYVKNKEYSSTKYNLKKKVITTEENNTVKLDTIYTFTNKK